MKDFPRGMYVMDDGTIMDFHFDWDCDDWLADNDDDPEEFGQQVKEYAKMFGVRPKDIADEDGWKNVGMFYYDLYDEDGEFLDNGPEFLYCDLKTFEHYSKRNLNGVLPVKRIPEDEAERIRV